MTRIRFHRVDNTDYPRYHGIWFKKFAKYCEQYFDVEWVNYAVQSDQGHAQITLQTPVSTFETTPPLSDVDCIIENLDTNKFVVLTFTEYFNHFVVHYLKSDYCQKICSAHFSWHNMYHWLKRDSILHKSSLVSPWFFGSYTEYDIEKYRTIRNSIETLDDELFYKGSGIGSYREVVRLLHDQKIVNTTSTHNHDSYMTKLASAKCALSYYMDLDKYYTAFEHPGEFCYRDMEYMALGVPFIRIEYKDAVYDGLVPNYHYISIPREYAYDAYRVDGNSGVATLIQQKFDEVRRQPEFLEYISNNQLTWFDAYAKWPNSAQFTLQLTGMESWI